VGGGETPGAPDTYSGGSPFRTAKRAPLLERLVPVSAQLRSYRPGTAKRDAVAGLTVAALAVPSAMAYAEVAGLSPVRGLYALLLPTVAYVLLGSSRQLIIGPEGSLATLTAAAILPLAVAGSGRAGELAGMLALLVGVCFLIAWVIRLGWLADYFSRPVLIGYIHGVVVVLIVGQLGKMLGLRITASDPLPQLAEIFRELGSTSGLTVLVGGLALAVLLLARVFAPSFPTPLVVVVAAIGVSAAFNLDQHGVAVVGHVPAGLPSLKLPRPPLVDIVRLVPAAVGIFAVGFADEILTARSFAGRNGQHVRAPQELLSMGAASIASGLTQGFPVGASGSRTAVNDSMGARTQFAGLFGAAAIALILVFLTAPIEKLPKAVLGAVIVSAAIGLVDIAAWRGLLTTDRFEVSIAAATTIGVVVVGVLEALVFAVSLAVIDVVRRSARPHDAVLGWVETLGRYGDVSLHRSARVTPGVVVYRIDDRIFFANARYMKGRAHEAIRAAPSRVHTLVLDAESLNHIDATGAEALTDLVQELRNDGITLVVARLKSLPKRHFDDTGLTQVIGHEHFHPTVREAVNASTDAEAGRQQSARP
jgi:high affinity sulfate transporter 1